MIFNLRAAPLWLSLFVPEIIMDGLSDVALGKDMQNRLGVFLEDSLKTIGCKRRDISKFFEMAMEKRIQELVAKQVSEILARVNHSEFGTGISLQTAKNITITKKQ